MHQIGQGLVVLNIFKLFFISALYKGLFTPPTGDGGRSPVMHMNKRHGHYCRLCGCRKPNEAFSGKGHRDHVCKSCSSMPKTERDSIEQKDEIFNFLRQSNISKKNIIRLTHLVESPDEEVAYLAGIVLEVAKVKPHKKRRLKVLAKERRDLLAKLDETGLVFAHHRY